MKKKIIAIGIGMMLCAGLFTGCGKTEVKQDTVAASSSEEGKQEETAEEKELTGTIDEIKDFMFVVTDANNTPYSFTFEEKPEGLENVSNGDTVTVTYTLSCRSRILSDGNKSAFFPYLCRTFVQLHLPCQNTGTRRLLHQPHIRRVHLANACILSINKKYPEVYHYRAFFYLCHFFRINTPPR